MLIVALSLLLSACAPSVIDRTIALSPESYYTPTPGSDMQPQMDRLIAVLKQGGYTVEVIPDLTLRGQPVFGLHDRFNRVISISGDLSVNSQFETLAHEAGHAFHSVALFQDSYSAAEVFAELVGNRVQRFYGSKTALTTSSTYLAKFKHALAFLPFLERDMEQAVKVLTGQAPWPVLEAK